MKRKREEDQPPPDPAWIKVEYTNLPNDSRRKLNDLLQEWKSWHAHRFPPGYRPSEVQSGILRYDINGPIAELPSTVLPVLDDRPSPPAVPLTRSMWFNIQYERTGEVPTYQRAIDRPLTLPRYAPATAAAAAAVGSKVLMRTPSAPARLVSTQHANSEAVAREKVEDDDDDNYNDDLDSDDLDEGEEQLVTLKTPRSDDPSSKRMRHGQQCFNCGSYAHALRDCWRDYNPAAVAAARQALMSSKASNNKSLPKRYFLETGDAKGEEAREEGEAVEEEDLTAAEELQKEFPGVVPGAVSATLREALGLGPLDPPPWLPAMRALGIPPAYRLQERNQFVEEGVAKVESILKNIQSALDKYDNVPPEKLASLLVTSSPAPVPGLTSAGQGIEFGEHGSGSGSGLLMVVEEGVGALSSSLEEGEWPDGGDISPSENQLKMNDSEKGTKSDGNGEEAALGVLDFIALVDEEDSTLQQEERESSPKDGGLKLFGNVVVFPGINAPIPEGADPAKWGQRPLAPPPPAGAAPVLVPPPRRALMGLHPPRSASGNTSAPAPPPSVQQYNPAARQYNAPVDAGGVPPPPVYDTNAGSTINGYHQNDYSNAYTQHITAPVSLPPPQQQQQWQQQVQQPGLPPPQPHAAPPPYEHQHQQQHDQWYPQPPPLHVQDYTQHPPQPVPYYGNDYHPEHAAYAYQAPPPQQAGHYMTPPPPAAGAPFSEEYYHQHEYQLQHAHPPPPSLQEGGWAPQQQLAPPPPPPPPPQQGWAPQYPSPLPRQPHGNRI